MAARKKAIPRGMVVPNSGNTLVKDLVPRDSDLKYYGPEPSFSQGQPDPERREFILMGAYNWYSHFYTHKEAKEFLISYLETKKTDKDIIKLIRRAPDHQMITTAGWVARCAMRGLELTPRNIEYVQQAIDKLVTSGKSSLASEEADALKKNNRVNIQEVMRERADEAAGEVEGFFDEFVKAGCKSIDIDKKVLAEFQTRNVLPQHVAPYLKRLEGVLAEYKEAQAGTCEQLNEGYSHYSKTQMKNLIKFTEAVIAQLNGYVSIKKATKAPRKRKPVPVEKIVSKLKHCKSFKDPTIKLDLVGLHPVKLHEASEAWVYDTRKRKMHHYVADDYSKVLLVKGNAILGFDKKQSGVKTLRKPAEQIKAMTGSKPTARKFFEAIKAVQSVPNGRFNEDMIILKAW